MDIQSDNILLGVTCVARSDCWAVGFGGTANIADVSQTLAEHWDGSTWSIVPTPDTSFTQPNQLSAISCPSTTDCWAVGRAVPAKKGDVQNLVEHWDGNEWSIVASRDTKRKQINELNAVTCVGGSDCWAAGIADNGAGLFFGETLAEHWDGTAWSIVRTPDASGPSVGSNELNGISCSAISDCWAVGIAFTGSMGPNHTLAEHWDGRTWNIVASPNTSLSQTNVLSGVTCATSSDCWAVGLGGSSNEEVQTLAEHWDGTAWSIVPTPDTSVGLENRLLGVTCVSSADCWAVGDATLPSDTGAQSLAERWNGSAWSIAPTQDVTSSPVNSLDGTVCSTASNCWSVGWFSDTTSGEAQTLVEHRI
jgi:hypothetical protein